MKVNVFILLVLGAVASGTAVWATNELNAANQKADSSFCCGFCVPGEPCEFCDLKKNASATEVKPVSLKQGKTDKGVCCGFCVPGEPCEFCDLKNKAKPTATD